MAWPTAPARRGPASGSDHPDRQHAARRPDQRWRAPVAPRSATSRAARDRTETDTDRGESGSLRVSPQGTRARIASGVRPAADGCRDQASPSEPRRSGCGARSRRREPRNCRRFQDRSGSTGDRRRRRRRPTATGHPRAEPFPRDEAIPRSGSPHPSCLPRPRQTAMFRRVPSESSYVHHRFS